MSSLDSNIALIVATLDLKLVQLLRDAIRVTDIAGAVAAGNLSPAATFEPRRHFTPTPVIEPRRHFHPTPRYEPRPILLLPRAEPPPPVICPVIEPAVPHVSKSPFVPPWKVMPWENPPQPALKVKVIKIKPDIVRKGSLIDFFI